jgi:hypothetical protein
MFFLSGSAGWIAPPVANLPPIERFLDEAGNTMSVVRTIPVSDHRLERAPGPDESGCWRLVDFHPAALGGIPDFLRDRAGVTVRLSH